MGIPVVERTEGYTVHAVRDGSQVEVFTTTGPEHRHFATGPSPVYLSTTSTRPPRGCATPASNCSARPMRSTGTPGSTSAPRRPRLGDHPPATRGRAPAREGRSSCGPIAQVFALTHGARLSALDLIATVAEQAGMDNVLASTLTGLVAFAVLCRQLLGRLPTWLVLVLASFAWALVSLLLYAAVRVIRAARRSRSGSP